MQKSESVTKLAEALAKAQAEIKTIVKDRTNPHFKNRYATLDAIMEGVRPVLAKHGLSVIQGATEKVDGFAVVTMLLHSSGEWLSNTVPVPVDKANAQGVGSAITYGRRYGVSALLGLATDEDDDGQAASTTKKPEKKEEKKPEPQKETPAFDGSLESAMTFPYPAKGDHHGTPLGEVPPEVLQKARDHAHKTDATKYADFIARADKVLAFLNGAQTNE